MLDFTAFRFVDVSMSKQMSQAESETLSVNVGKFRLFRICSDISGSFQIYLDFFLDILQSFHIF